jgi:hypothetical protein
MIANAAALTHLSRIAWMVLGLVAFPAAASSEQETPNARIYAAMATAAAKMAEKLSYDSLYGGDPDSHTVALDDCGGGGLQLGLTESDPQFDAAATAVWAFLLRKKLASMRLTEVGEPYIRRIEQITIKDMSAVRHHELFDAKWPAVLDMARALNTALRARNLRAGFEESPSGCGAGEVAYRLVPSDKSAKLFVIKSFYFLVCQARGVDPFDRQNCNGWNEATDRERLTGAGRYAYVALWPDGTSTNGNFQITDKTVDDIRDERRKDLLVITIRR